MIKSDSDYVINKIEGIHESLGSIECDIDYLNFRAEELERHANIIAGNTNQVHIAILSCFHCMEDIRAQSVLANILLLIMIIVLLW